MDVTAEDNVDVHAPCEFVVPAAEVRERDDAVDPCCPKFVDAASAASSGSEKRSSPAIGFNDGVAGSVTPTT